MEQSRSQRSGRVWIEAKWQDAADAMFTELIVSRGIRALRSDRWNVAPRSLAVLPGNVLLHQYHSFGTDEWLLDFPPSAFALIQHEGEAIRVRVAADSDPEAQRILSQMRVAVPETTPPARSVRVTFWTLGEHGPQSVTKDFGVPTWPDIERNYPAVTAHGLTPLLVDAWRPPAGRLLLWHGDPGTGKTHAVRALMRAWKEWCSFHVILDPEKFFGSDAQYMVNVLLTQGDDDGTAPNGNGAPRRWRLLILEDTGELLSVDAKDRAGQGLSRLLNLCDGLLGQSLNVLVLITTNEDFGRMHPAVVRPGRCLANVEFRCFDSADARRWLADHGLAVPDQTIGRTALAGLYSQLQGHSVPARDSVVGFLSP